jgi:N-acetylated-alpha-linked acidic dipeptidase
MSTSVRRFVFRSRYVYEAKDGIGRASQEDFKRLLALGIELEGKIALAKYGGPFRGLKVKNAQAFGMIGAVIFTDPGDDKNMTAKNYDTYPNGPARNPTSIQKGSVMDLSTYPGDPTTPGYPSKEGSIRMEKETVPKIPSLPMSWIGARPVLMALNGFGVDAKTIDRANWVGAIDGVKYSSGPSKATLSMSNIMKDEINWIHNAVGIINGTNEDEVVIVGNHHDSWMLGGAGTLQKVSVCCDAVNDICSGSTLRLSDPGRVSKGYRRSFENRMEAEENYCAL